MNKILLDVRETGENRITLFDHFNPKIVMIGSKSLEEFFRRLIAKLQPIEASFELDPSSSIIIYNLFLMTKLGKLNLQINIKRVKGESFRSFFEWLNNFLHSRWERDFLIMIRKLA